MIPERMWAEMPEVFDGMGFWQESQSADLVQYIRADLHEAEVARLTAERDAAVAASQKLAAENARLVEAMKELAKDPRDEGIAVGDGWDFYTDAVNYARAFLAGGDK